jgi:hypothetical protein
MIVRERRTDTVATPQRRARQETGRILHASQAGRERVPNGAVVFLISVALIAAVGMLYLLQTNHVASLGYEMSRLQEEREAALVEQNELAAQIAGKQAITQVGLVARRDLGMEEMEDFVFLDVTFPAETSAEADAKPEEDPSILERFWGRLTGTSEAGSDSEDGR